MTMANRIKEARKKSGHCQLSLSMIVGCEQHAISNWERGKAFPRAVFIVDLCQAIGITPNYLYGWEE